MIRQFHEFSESYFWRYFYVLPNCDSVAVTAAVACGTSDAGGRATEAGVAWRDVASDGWRPRRGGRGGPTEAGAAASEAAEVRAGAACFLSILRP